MSQSWFVTGTDTDVGKTYVTALLMQALQSVKQTCIGYKPISAGCEQTESGLRNEDALILQQHSSLELSYEAVNPVAFAPAIAPHIAAQKARVELSIESLLQGLQRLQGYQQDHVFVEGAGGWRLPLGNGQFLSELAVRADLPVILVVELKLGCLNHACLTAQAIQQDGLILAGWVANCKNTDMQVQTENIAALTALIPAPLLGVLPFDDSSKTLSHQRLDVSLLTNNPPTD